MSERNEAVEAEGVRDMAASYVVASVEFKPDAVPTGYKRTELGVIPKDWTTGRVGDFATLGRGRVISHNEIRKSITQRYPVYSSQTSQKGLMGSIDTYDFDGEYVTWTTDGVNAGSVFYRNGRFNCTNVCGTIKTRKGVDPKFLSLILNQHTFQYVSRNLANPKLMNGVMASIKLPFPSQTEQHAIATALSDADALIDSLDRLIAKKRAIKQGVMQQLLTGRKRLPGFTGEWETKQLGDLGVFYKGRGIRRDDVSDEGVPCIRYGEIYTRYDNYITEPESRIPRNIALSAFLLKTGDILFAGSGETAEEIGMCLAYLGEKPAFAGGDIIILRPLYGISSYLGHLLNHPSIARQKARLGQGDAVVHISARNLSQIELRLPPEDEQAAIAAVLSDMDAEIEALESRRDKARQIKHGMMQQLLTGRVRLVEPEVQA